MLEGEQRSEIQQGLVQSNPPDVSVIREQVDIETARKILQAIVNTHESTITETTPLEHVGGYSIEKVRQAEEVIAQGILGIADDAPINTYRQEKTIADQELRLSYYKSGELGSRRSVELELGESSGGGILDYRVPLAGKGNFTRQFGATEFTDYRTGLLGVITQPSVESEDITAFRHLWRGLRWMSANMLNWDKPTVVMPEQLNRPSLPSAPTTSIQPSK